MSFILALLPILLILFCMIGLRWSASRSGGVGYIVSLLIAWLFFGGNLGLIGYAHMKALLLSIDVIIIIWAAFLFYRVADEAGAIRAIGQALPYLTPDKGMQALLIAWVFASFIQGVGGFGVPVAVISPILVSLGFDPLLSVVMSSIGHAWGVTFGSLGSSFQALLAATAQPEKILAPPSALFLGIAGWFGGLMVAHISGGWSTTRRLFLKIFILGLVMGGVQYLVASYGPWNISAFSGAIAGLIVGLPLSYRKMDNKNEEKKPNKRGLITAISGYVILIIVILGVQFITPIHEVLGKVVLKVEFPEIRSNLGFITSAGIGRNIVVFRHIGVVLVYISIIAYLIYWKAGCYQPGSIQRILDSTLRKVLPSTVSILSMVTMSVIMEHTGMTDLLARGLAKGVGMLFPIVSPWIGALGAFMTGSNTNSNVVFGNLQLQTAVLLDYPIPIILAAQTSGAAIASVLAPTKIVVGVSTVGLVGAEGVVMRKLFIYIGVLILIISIITILLS